MPTIEQLLQHLARPYVTELALASERLPCVKINGKFEAVDQSALSTDAILQKLTAAGGSRHVGGLGSKPVQWAVKVSGVGTVAVAAVLRDGKVQARFAVSKREGSVEVAPVVPDAPARSPTGDEPTRKVPVAAALRGLDVSVSVSASAAAAPALAAAAAPAPAAAAAPAAAPASADASAPASAPASTSSAITIHAARQLEGSSELDSLLAAARDAGASDLHVIAERPLLFRIAGELVPRGEPLSAARVEGMIHPHIPARCIEALDKDGSCDFALERPARGRFRVNVTRQRTGWKACLRIIPRGIPTLAALGLPEEIASATHHHQGLIVVTGPTGHGKTSTLAAIVDIINRETTHHVITVEDPVEYVHPQMRAVISQREIGTHTLSFQSALKASLREDPDVIVVGELRDTETVRMALSASETGHLVLGTMNTPSAAKTIDRLIDLFPPNDQQQVRMTLAGGLRLIVSQRLLPSSDGKGMVAAAELLPGSIALWSLIRDNKTFQIPSLQQRGKGVGIIRLDDSLAELVRQGKATREAAMAIAEAPDELLAGLDGAQKKAASPAPAPEAKRGEGGLLQRAGSLFGGGKKG